MADATAEPGTATETKPAETPAVVAKPVETEAKVTLTAKELADLHAELTGFRKAEKDKTEAERLKAEKAAIDKGQWETIIKAREAERDQAIKEKKDETDRLAKLESETAASMVDRDLALALNMDSLVTGSSTQLLKLWRDDFEAKRVDGRWVVQTRDGKSPATVVKERLASTDYSHFVKASHRGGAGGDGKAATTTADGTDKDLTPLQKVAANLAAAKNAYGGRGISFPVMK